MVAFIPLAMAAKVRRVERRAIARLHDAGASTVERAILMDRNGWVAAFVHRRLEHAGVLRSAPNDRYYMDEPAYRHLVARRRRRAVALIGLIIASLAVMYFRGDLS